MGFFGKIYKKVWLHSRLRFYALNAAWNYSFWLTAKPIYKVKSYDTFIEIDEKASINDGIMDRLKSKKEKKSFRRFSGFLFRGKLYKDNPGIQGLDQETYASWRKKGLI
jgi:hypothetical protein